MSWDGTLSSGGVQKHGTGQHVNQGNPGTYAMPFAVTFDDAGAESAAYQAWSATPTYPANTFVLGSDSKLYRAVVSNQGNDPTTDDGSHWTRVSVPTGGSSAGQVAIWNNTTKEYEAGSVSGTIASGTVAGNTLRWNGSAWVESSVLSNDGNGVTITPASGVGLTVSSAQVGQIAAQITGVPGSGVPALQVQTDSDTAAIFLSTGSYAGVKYQTNVNPVNNTPLSVFYFRGKEPFGAILEGARIQAQGAGTWSATSSPGKVYILTTPAAATTATARVLINSNGDVVLNASVAALPTNATGGFTFLPNCAGMPTGAPTGYTGASAFVFNSTGNSLNVYNGGSWFNIITPPPVALTDQATIATDASLGNVFKVTLGGNRTMGAPTNPTSGQKIIYRITQDATGSRTITWNSIFRFSTSVPSPTLSTAAGKEDYIGFIYNSTDTKWDCLATNIGFN